MEVSPYKHAMQSEPWLPPQVLKQRFQPKLNFPGCGARGGDASKCRRLNVIVLPCELGSVEQVEKLAFELKGETLYREIFSGVKVEIEVPRTNEIIAPLVAKRIGCWCRKALRIEPFRSGFRSRASRVRNPFGPLRTSARIGHIASSHCTERQPGVGSDNTVDIPASD